MSKYLYTIKKLNTKSWIKYWLEKRATGQSEIKLSDIITGTNFTLNGTIQNPFKIFNIRGNSIQNGEPSPNNEVPILSAGENGSINEEIVNKNLLNLHSYSTSVNGVTQTYDNNHVSISGTPTVSWNLRLSGTKITLKAGTYTLSGCPTGGGWNNYGLLLIDDNDNSIVYVDYGSSKTFTLTEEHTFMLWFRIGSSKVNTAIDLNFYIQLQPGSTATPYTPHQHQDISIPTQQPMRSSKDKTVYDYFFKNVKGSKHYDENLIEDMWYERHEMAEKILDGTEGWLAFSQGATYKRTGTDLPGVYNNGTSSRGDWFICSHFNYNAEFNTDKIGNCFYSNADSRFYVYPSQQEDVNDFKNWLSTHNVAVQYLLNDPINLPCTQAQITALENLKNLTTYPEQTNIMSTDEVPANLEIQYYERKN